ncbi:MAG: hypothetical protein ACLSA6_04035 [Holdemania massiliensis]
MPISKLKPIPMTRWATSLKRRISMEGNDQHLRCLGRILTATDKANVTTYTYDAKGQRLSQATTRQTTTFEYDAWVMKSSRR